tara:strand:+ start:1440 stop:2015 length:576 start_codon:yes stop_codon:yes gene_type:complete
MKFDWVYYTSQINTDTVDSIVERGLNKQFNFGTVDLDNHRNFELDRDHRRSKVFFFDEFKDSDFFNLVYRLGTTTNNANFGFDINQLQALQFSIYDSKYKGKYDWHQDIQWTSDELYHRKLSVVIQLSEPNEYVGGNFEIQNSEFTKQEKTDMKQKGSVIVFPSFLTHRVTPVTKGKRKSLIGWLVGPKFK